MRIWQASWRRSGSLGSPESPSGARSPATIDIACVPGRLRQLRHLALLPLVGFVGWGWFGVTGAVPVVIWWVRRRPPPAGGTLRIDPARVRWVRLGPWRTVIGLRGAPAVDVFRDEARSDDLARLRRLLKTRAVGRR